MATTQRGEKSSKISKMKVRVLSEELLKPKTPADHPKLLELSVIDQVQPRFHGPPMLAFLGPMPDALPFEEFVQRSKEAWARTLVAYYPLAGRLVRQKEGCLAIDCNDAGILVRAAEADCPLPQEMVTGTSMAGSDKLFFTERGEDITTVPLLLIQFTRFQDNSLCMYFGFHHTVSDGASSSLAAYYWIELFKGKEPPFVPVHDRSLLKASGEPVPSKTHAVLGLAPTFPIPKVVKIMLGSPRLKRVIPYLPKRMILPDVPLHRLFFSKGKLEALKKDACEGLPAGRFVSTNDALTALLWRSISAARGLHKIPEQKTRLAFAADGRSKTEPPLPEEYFGGANITTLSDATAADLQNQPLSWSASKVRDSVSRVDAGYVRNVVDWIAEQPNKAALGLNINAHLGPDLLVSILTKFPIDLMDLGWGNALAVAPGKYHIPFDGLVVLVGSRGGVCAFVSLLAGHMKKLMKHEPLLKYVG
ncbi:HXXXD-type acyl-transferase family protein [Klebsormidium nitens]|uniref:HXXXD-type acyl-transferase family protein n=1 Tax=Klebsormidium nitens TaxID=105231 RepID=A0A1Y1IJP9_KLENI|nr:HXXXD-type acyl-transferase family protein [Klebsormidium nitens]|eukprot:GAQ89351.1 HXXXD-type acyl-transferase family protein [Klebsormidium nitens]